MTSILAMTAGTTTISGYVIRFPRITVSEAAGAISADRADLGSASATRHLPQARPDPVLPAYDASG